jgi:hypothetical protein
VVGSQDLRAAKQSMGFDQWKLQQHRLTEQAGEAFKIPGVNRLAVSKQSGFRRSCHCVTVSISIVNNNSHFQEFCKAIIVNRNAWDYGYACNAIDDEILININFGKSSTEARYVGPGNLP